MSESSASLSQPLYGASLPQAVARFFRKYATFCGRASRSEYWWVWLAQFLVGLVTATLIAAGGGYDFQYLTSGGVAPTSPLITIGYVLSTLISLATLVPWLAVIWRRLHDANLAGPMFFLTFIPIVGGIILIVLLTLPSKPEGARFDVRPTAA